jgi:hypothetical protein
VRRVRVLELRVFIDPVEPKCLSSILLMNQRDLLAVDLPVVALDDKVLADAPAYEFRAVLRESELYGERMGSIPFARSSRALLLQPRSGAGAGA